jgi:hypothetical protein
MDNIHRHHYIPQGFLKNFTIEDNQNKKMIYCYEKNKYIKKERKVSIKSIVFETDYYATENADGTINYNELERLIGELENKVIPIITNLKEKNNEIIITEEKKIYILYFISQLMMRVPSFRNGIENIYREVVLKIFNNKEFKEFKDINQMINDGIINLDIKNWISLEPMIKISHVMFNSLLSKNMQFFTPPDNCNFITTDTPVVFYGIAPAHPDSIVSINLRKDLCLFFTPMMFPFKTSKEPTVKKISVESLNLINKKNIMSAKKYVLSNINSEDTLTEIKKYINYYQGIK